MVSGIDVICGLAILIPGEAKIEALRNLGYTVEFVDRLTTYEDGYFGVKNITQPIHMVTGPSGDLISDRLGEGMYAFVNFAYAQLLPQLMGKALAQFSARAK